MRAARWLAMAHGQSTMISGLSLSASWKLFALPRVMVFKGDLRALFQIFRMPDRSSADGRSGIIRSE
jgi:hypothetical protein